MTDEAELISRCRQADSAAWDELFDRFYPVAARFVFQLSADFSHEDTEELCQETFLSVVRNLDSFHSRSAFQTWLLRIASNKAMDFREKARAAKRGGGLTAIPLHTDERHDEPHIDPPSTAPGPDASLLSAERFALLRRGLDQLDAPCREVIELRYYGDLSYEEIAATLRLNPKTVSSRLSKCLAKLGTLTRAIFPQEDARAFTV